MQTTNSIRSLLWELYDRVMVATSTLIALALVLAVTVVSIDPALVVLGAGSCAATIHAYATMTDRPTYRLTSLGTCATLYGAFLLAGGGADIARIHALLALGLMSLFKLVADLQPVRSA